VIANPLSSRGLHTLKGVASAVHVYGLPSDQIFEASQAPAQIPAPIFNSPGDT
jgi:hypothetical protein